ncbi:BamA/TamA family outer membrane protein [Albimonas sp. CAU 1670]|uniref:autotransporter assembly complex protein TamA n=1 Tax=Albimonas sp. CAU 1670 TaxID=3032599 RepID=UPI0023D9E614|nr:BamA/TamA family outer membrane protein [Albimonas sp. CAU 1670]MDF2232986.1 BamA/TamA family outer membrane protein [Albimonas sp. CAU 1670]
MNRTIARASGPTLARRAAACTTLALALSLGGCGLFGERKGDFPPLEFAEPESAVEYEVELVGSPRDEATSALEESLSLYRRQEDGAPSLAILRRRAEQDVEATKKILRSFGYYRPTVKVEVEKTGEEAPAETAQAAPERREPQPVPSYTFGQLFGSDEDEAADPADEDGTPGAEPAGPRETAVARVIIDPGPAFRLTRHEFVVVGDPSRRRKLDLMTPEQAGSPVGRRADAGEILAAEDKAVAALLYDGRPWAKLQGRRAIADMEAGTIEIETSVDPGPYAEYGEIEVSGTDKVVPQHIRGYRDFRHGRPVDRRDLRQYQSDLMETELFDSVIVKVPDQPPSGASGDAVPILVDVVEGPRNTATAGLRFNTDSGPEARAGYTQRNLFGRGERVDVTGVLGQSEQSLTVEGRKPQFLQRRQTLTGFAQARHIEDNAYDETGATLSAGLERERARYWTFGGGGLVEYSNINDQLYSEDVVLLGLPAYVRYDGSDDLLNPTEGVRAAIYGTPYYAFRDRGDSQFLRAETIVSGYLPIDEEHRYVLASRGRLGSIFAENLNDVPLTKRLYSGGGGSVRGYGDQMIGPIDRNNDPTGGRSVVELSVEARARVYGDIGVVAFVDAGSVSTAVAPDFSDGVQYAAGVGGRYYSPVGPIRFDLAFPLNGRKIDDAFGFYFSIGQAY